MNAYSMKSPTSPLKTYNPMSKKRDFTDEEYRFMTNNHDFQ